MNFGGNYYTIMSAHSTWLYPDVHGGVHTSKKVVDGWQVWELENYNETTNDCHSNRKVCAPLHVYNNSETREI